jgi:hypothetical protein
MYDRGEIMTKEERLSIVEWVKTNIEKMQVLSLNRLQYKIFIDDMILPKAIWRIKKRLIEREGLHEYRQDPMFHDILINILNGGIIHPHTDPNGLFDGTIHCRFNVFIQVPDNFDTYYGGYLVEAKNGHYVMCRSGLDTHWSNMNTTESRISLSFGYLLPQKKVDELYNTRGAIQNKGIPPLMINKIHSYLTEKRLCLDNGI